MPFLKWENSYSVGVSKIDEQHKKIFELINKLYKIENMKPPKDIGNIRLILEEMAQYANYHFETEEKYFDLYDYEGKEIHKNQHNEYRKKTEEFYEKYKIDEKFLIFSDVLNFLKDWRSNHINGFDKKYVKCFNDNGLK